MKHPLVHALLVTVLALGALVALSGFTTPTTPARHPTTPTGLNNPAIYVLDPHAGGASGGVPNVTPAVPATLLCTQSQAISLYDDGGSLGVNCIDTYNGTSTGTTTTPSAPSTGQVTAYSFQLDAGMPILPLTVDNYFGTPSPQGIASVFTYYSTTMKWSPQCWLVLGWGKNINYLIGADTASQVGTVSNPAWANTSLLTRSKARRFTAGSAANNVNYGVKPDSATQVAWRGNASGAGGWFFWTRFSVATAAAGLRYFVGMQNSVTLMTSTVDPNTITDAVGIECQAGDSNFSICSNDNSGTATCSTLGSGFPCATAGAFYDVWLSAAPNASSIEYFIERLDTAAQVGGSLTSDLPRNTVQLNWQVLGNTGTGSTAIAMDWMGTCVLANL